MKKVIVFLFLFFTTNLWAQYAVPIITAAEKAFEYGNVIQGEMARHEFTVTNTGEKELKISRVRASCGCTAAEPDKKLLKPGESTKIKVEFNSTGRQGIQRKYIYIYSNDTANPELRLTFTSNVIPKKYVVNGEIRLPKLQLAERRHDFGDAKEGDILTTEIEFENAGKSELEISQVRTSCGCVAAVTSEKIIPAGGKGTLKIELDTTGRTGKLTRTVTVFSSDPENSRALVTLFVNILPKDS